MSPLPAQQPDFLTRLIPVISLVIAALAVVFGPIITLRISRRQFDLSRRIADKQIIAPMRQAWINSLREKVAELTSSALHYWNQDWSQLHGSSKKNEDEKRMIQLEHEIELLINPSEADHKELVTTIREMMWSLDVGLQRADQFAAARQKTIALGQKIFKAEWNRTKQDIEKD
jgi:hypothetical protein